MTGKQERKTEDRNASIRKEYEQLSKVIEYGKEKHSHEWICAKLAHEWYLSEITIHRIVTGRNATRKVPKAIYAEPTKTKPKDDNQLDLFKHI